MADFKNVPLRLQNGEGQIRQAIETVIGTLRSTFGFGILNPRGNLAADDDASFCQLHFLPKLVRLPSRLHDGRRDELGADVPLAEVFFVQGRSG